MDGTGKTEKKTEGTQSLSEQFIDLIKTKYGDDEVSPILQYLSREGFWKDNSFSPDTETKIKEAVASGKYDLAEYVDDFYKDVKAERQDAEDNKPLSEQFIDLYKSKYGEDEVPSALNYLDKIGVWKDGAFTPDAETEIQDDITSGKRDLAKFVEDAHEHAKPEEIGKPSEDGGSDKEGEGSDGLFDIKSHIIEPAEKSLSAQFIDLVKSKYGEDAVEPMIQELREAGYWKNDAFDPELENNIKEEIAAGKFDLTDFVEQVHQYIHQYDMDDEQDKDEESEYPIIESEIKKRFASNPDDCKIILDTFKKALQSNSRDQWIDYINKICKKGEDKANIQTRLIPQLVKVYNKHNGTSPIDLPQRTASTYLGKDAQILVPEDMNKPAAEFSDKPVFKQCGVPMINFSSNIMREIRKEHDKDHLKELLREFIKVAEKTDIANALGKFVWLGKRSNVYKVLQGIAQAKTIPVTHSTLIALTDPKGFATDLKSDVTVHKIDEAADDLTESVSVLDYGDVLTEGIFDFVHGKRTEGSTNAIGQEFKMPRSYLRQFYDVVDPSSPQGWSIYSKLMHKNLVEKMKNTVSKDPKMLEQVKNSNLPVKQAFFNAYAAMNNGIPIFYVLAPKADLNERIQLSQKPLLRGMYVVRSTSNGKSVAYFVTKEQKENWFEIS